MEPGLRDRENTEDYGIGVINAVAAMEPGLRDRENRKRRFIAPDGRDAAMEPGLRDRENRRSRRASASGITSRNGARPERPGKPPAAASRWPPWRCRNGARPERPGKRGHDSGPPVDADGAAMEPGLRDRENPWRRGG